MKTNVTQPLRTRRGFTLVELIVVLMILVGLAAVLIPAVTDMVVRTNRSSSASNIGEIAGAIQRYDAQYMAYPDNMDSLLTNKGTYAELNTLPTNLKVALEKVVLDANTLGALTTAGINFVGMHATDDGTFALPTISALAVDDEIAALTAVATEALGLEYTGSGAAGKYVAFGIGPRCDMNGKTMIDAPVHFPRNSSTNPDTTYSRFIAIFQITDGTDALQRARFVGMMAPDAGSLSDELDGYFKVTALN